MTTIGHLKPYVTDIGEEYHGQIQTLKMSLNIKFIPNMAKSSEKAPDYIICAESDNGIDVVIGSAWTKRKAQINNADFEFLSITIDDPSLPEKMNIAAFKNPKGGWDITWRRRQDN